MEKKLIKGIQGGLKRAEFIQNYGEMKDRGRNHGELRRS